MNTMNTFTNSLKTTTTIRFFVESIIEDKLNNKNHLSIRHLPSTN